MGRVTDGVGGRGGVCGVRCMSFIQANAKFTGSKHSLIRHDFF